MWFIQGTLNLQEDDSSNIDTFDWVRDALRIWLSDPLKAITLSESPSKLTFVADSMHLYQLTEPNG